MTSLWQNDKGTDGYGWWGVCFLLPFVTSWSRKNAVRQFFLQFVKNFIAQFS